MVLIDLEPSSSFCSIDLRRVMDYGAERCHRYPELERPMPTEIL